MCFFIKAQISALAILQQGGGSNRDCLGRACLGNAAFNLASTWSKGWKQSNAWSVCKMCSSGGPRTAQGGVQEQRQSWFWASFSHLWQFFYIHEATCLIYNPCVCVQYAEMEMRNRFINHARNVWDRAVTLLPRIDQLWYKVRLGISSKPIHAPPARS